MVSDYSHESLYAFITRHATHASDRRLLVLLAAALGGVTGAILLPGWPLLALSIGALSGSLVTVALWGFAAHFAQRHPRPVLSSVERVLAGVGIGLACVAAAAFLLAMLGQPWTL